MIGQPPDQQGLMQRLIAMRNARMMQGGNGANPPPPGANIPQMGMQPPVQAGVGNPQQPNPMIQAPQQQMGAPNPAIIQAMIQKRQQMMAQQQGQMQPQSPMMGQQQMMPPQPPRPMGQ